MAQETRLERAAEALEKVAGPSVDRGAELYDRFAAPIREQVKFIASTVPIAGALVSALDDVLGARAATIREQRMHELLRMTVELGKALDESKVDRDFLGSREWSALVEGAMLKAARTWQEDKRRMFAQFLVNASKKGPANSGPSSGYRERLLNVVDDLTIGHVAVLQVVAGWTPTRARPMPVKHDDPNPSFADLFPGMGVKEACGYLSDLEARRLLTDQMRATRKLKDETGEVFEFPWLMTTPQGFEVLDFMSAPDATGPSP